MKDVAYIQSRQNAQIKDLRRLLTSRGRRQQGKYLIEGHHLVKEALIYDQVIETMLMTQEYYDNHFESLNQATDASTLILISESVAKELSETPAPQGVFAVIQIPRIALERWKAVHGKYLLLDGIQDPGNLGTLIRTASAADFDGVFLGTGTVDPYNAKVIRASQGAIWQIDLLPGDLSEAISHLQAIGVPVYASDLSKDSKDYRSLFVKGSVGIVLGNEGQGIRQEILTLATSTVHIPMPGQAESLNVGVAGGILMFHFINSSKQR